MDYEWILVVWPTAQFKDEDEDDNDDKGHQGDHLNIYIHIFVWIFLVSVLLSAHLERLSGLSHSEFFLVIMGFSQSVANNFSDERIQIQILFKKNIFYEYENFSLVNMRLKVIVVCISSQIKTLSQIN